jgi:hypothetical protein
MPDKETPQAGDVIVMNELDHAVQVAYGVKTHTANPREAIGFRQDPGRESTEHTIFEPIQIVIGCPPIVVGALPSGDLLEEVAKQLDFLPAGVPLHLESRAADVIQLDSIQAVRDQAATSGRAIVIRTVQ